MAISRSQQPRQNYGLGSFVKKAFNKVTRPFTKVAQKIVPKEIAGIARTAAPFVAGMGRPGLGALISALGQAKQKGRINPFETALSAAPGFAYGKDTFFGDVNTAGDKFYNKFGIGSLKNAETYGDAGSSLRNILTGGGVGEKSLGEGLLRDKIGTGVDNFLFESALGGDKGILGTGGDYKLLDNEIVDLAIKKKDGETLNPFKIGVWGTSIYSGIQAKKYKDEIEAADAAEAALKAADSAATEGDILEAREWAEIVFGRLSRADIGLAQGGRVNYAMGTGPVLPPDPTQPVNPFGPRPPADAPVLPNKEMAMSYGYDDAMSDTYNMFLQMKKDKQIPIDMEFDIFLLEVVPEMSKKQTREDRPMAANGGLMRANYALGTKPEPKESGLGGLPIEADMRYSGGFMPYGKKEKADDVPARLSKNEFVFTADAVKAAGGGSMNEGARKMYQTMKMLEQQNRMMS